jgi:hypothetical protein
VARHGYIHPAAFWNQNANTRDGWRKKFRGWNCEVIEL